MCFRNPESSIFQRLTLIFWIFVSFFSTALSWLRGTIEVHDEMDEMRAEYESIKLIPKVSMREMLTNAQLRIPLFIAMTVMVAQQLSGINAVSNSLRSWRFIWIFD